MLTKTTKALVAALVLTSASLALAANVNAAPRNEIPEAQKAWMDRASQSFDGAGGN